jgi:hypothetical protein
LSETAAYEAAGSIGRPCDEEYPSRSAFCVLGQMCDQYHEKVGDAWRTVLEAGPRGGG